MRSEAGGFARGSSGGRFSRGWGQEGEEPGWGEWLEVGGRVERLGGRGGEAFVGRAGLTTDADFGGGSFVGVRRIS